MLATALECAESAGRLLMKHFGHVRDIRIKDSRSSIVTEADLAADHLIRTLLQAAFPDHNLLTEESGFTDRGSAFTWVVDPLDGTSNFAAGLPWFGVMISALEHGSPVAAVMVLPAENLIYTAERGQGAHCNGRPVQVANVKDLSQVLCGFGLDAAGSLEDSLHQGRTLARLVQEVRNLRSTNSLMDFACTIDGRLGALVNFHTMIWDIAAPALILEEAGGIMTDLHGEPLNLAIDADAPRRSHAVAAAPPALHRQLLRLLAQ